jgi:hypothetical protein
MKFPFNLNIKNMRDKSTEETKEKVKKGSVLA